MGISVMYTEHEPPVDEPEFNFRKWRFPAGDYKLDRVYQQSSGEARNLWKVAERFGNRYRMAIDVGANVGCMSYALSLLYNSVYAFEPWFESRDCFSYNAREFIDSKDIRLDSRAVGAESGIMDIITGHPSRRDAKLVKSAKGMKGIDLSSQVEVVTLDEVFPKGDIDLIKIDVEGYELDVLRGATGIIERCKPLIYMEVKHLEGPVYGQYMRDIGYEELAKAGHNKTFGAV